MGGVGGENGSREEKERVDPWERAGKMEVKVMESRQLICIQKQDFSIATERKGE